MLRFYAQKILLKQQAINSLKIMKINVKFALEQAMKAQREGG